jgi:hypothetical protein
MITINTRADLDALQGTKEHDQFMQSLRGTLFTVQKDDDLKKWVAVENNDTIEQFGFTRADFEPIEQPSLPEYKPDNSETLQLIAELKDKLKATDYVTLSDYDKDKPEILADRQAWREGIRQLEQSL